MNVMFERNVPCTMRDGVVLMANIFRPADAGSYPVVMTRLPYGKDTPYLYYLDPVALAEAGYIVVVQDVRGRFASGGEVRLFDQEFQDGYDAIEWASKLPGSTGEVGMFGASYFGFTQLAAAASGHPALKTVAPGIVFDHPLEGLAFRGGALEWGLGATWHLMLAPVELARKAGREPDFPLRFYQLIQDIDHLPEEHIWDLPLTDYAPLKRSGLLPQFFETITRPLENTERLSIRPYYDKMTVSGLFTGGWFDIFTRSTLEAFQRFRAAGRPAQLVMGPWTHGNFGSTAGNLSFGFGANDMLLDLKEDRTTRHRRWYDATLKGMDNGMLEEPPIKLFMMGENRWKSVYEWPLPETVYTPWYLHSDGRAQTVSGDGRLSQMVPDSEAADRYVYDPANPVLTRGGSTLLSPEYQSGPVDQAPVEERSDVLVYTSEALTAPLEVTGPVTAKLWVSTSARDTDFVVRMADVHPDGRSYNVVDGIIRMRYRHGMDHEALLEPGTVYPITVDLWDTSIVFLPGHRIRIQVTSSCFPRWNRNLNTGRSNEETADYVAADQVLWHDREHPSHIILPVIPRL